MSSVSAPVSLSTKQNSQLWVLSSHSYFCKQIPPSFSFSLQPSRRIGEWVYFVEKVRKYFDRPTDRTLNRIKFWLLFFSSSGGFWNKRSGLEKALLVCLGVCGTVMVAGGSFYAAQQRNSGSLKKYIFSLLHNFFVTSNHQIMNLVFPNFFYEIFSAWAVKKKTNFYRSKTDFFLFWDQTLSLFIFIWSNWEKFAEKIGGNKIRGLVVWCLKQDWGQIPVNSHLIWIENLANHLLP